ncbi:MAG: ABC transporter ATP-binding protein [Candidatus Omnitrophica bacterium]|nr:ABC transporter ATP-binding protein [Candidatus Omnitrophota bacterium]
MFKEYFKFVRFLKPHSGLLGLAVFFMAVSSVFDWVSIAMIVPASDKILNNGKIIFPVSLPSSAGAVVAYFNSLKQTELLKMLIIFVPVLFLLKGVFNFLYSYYMSLIGQLCIRDIRFLLYEKIQGLSLDYFSKKRAGELISRITNDVKVVENALSYGVTDLVYQSFLVGIFTCTIFYIHWKLALSALVMIPLVVLPIVKVGRVLRKISRHSQEKMADINSLLVETISGIRIVKAFSMEHHEIERFRVHNQSYFKLAMRATKRMLLLSPATEFVGVLLGIFVLAWVGQDVIDGKISFGVFGLFLGSLFSLIRPLKKLSQVNSLNQQAVAASERIYEVLDTQPTVLEKANAIRDFPFKEKIVVENVWFNYGELPVLKGLNIEVKKGRMVAVVGPSGSGKSTLLDLVCRFYDPVRGRILLDDLDVKEASIVSLRKLIGIVTQETILFNDTIQGNIAYGKPGASRQEIEAAAAMAYADDFIKRLPRGYDTLIGDRGTKLSGGERQRIAIARALLKNPPILILDEATSQLDTESERIVQEALNKLIEGRTVLAVAHRLSTIKNAHKIIVLENGTIAEQGSHDELFAGNGVYRRLCMSQHLQV